MLEASDLSISLEELALEAPHLQGLCPLLPPGFEESVGQPILLALKSRLQQDAFLLLGIHPAYVLFGDDQESVLQEIVDALDFFGGVLFDPQGRGPLQYLQILFVVSPSPTSFLHGPRGLLAEVGVEELVVEEHASEVGYPGVINPMGGTIERCYPAVGEHQGKLRQVGPEPEEGLADSVA